MDVTRESSESAKREVGSKSQPESNAQKHSAEYDEESTEWGKHEAGSRAGGDGFASIQEVRRDKTSRVVP